MPLESATTINQLVTSNPASGDPVSEADDHIRLIKSTVRNTFPNITGVVNVDQALLNSLVNRLALLELGNPIGTIVPYAGSTAPNGHLFCHGQAVSRTTYSALFAAIGTTWGPGDGATTFNLPDLRGRSLYGRDNMGGTAANRITSGNSGINGTLLGAVGGDERTPQHTHTATQAAHDHTVTTNPGGSHSHNATIANSGAHTHTTNGAYWQQSAGGAVGGGGNSAATAVQVNSAGDHTHTITINADGLHSHTGTTNQATPAITVANAGAGTSQNVPPAAIVNYLIFAGV